MSTVKVGIRLQVRGEARHSAMSLGLGEEGGGRLMAMDPDFTVPNDRDS